MTTSLPQKSWLKWLVGFVVVAGLVFGLIFYHQKSPASLPTVAATKGNITEQAEAVGYIKTRHFSTVKSQVDGIVEAIYHEEGDHVKKDAQLAKVKPMPKPDQYAAAHKELANAKATENDAKVSFKRQEYLVNKKIISANDYNYTDAHNEYIQARNNRLLAEQKLALLESGEITVAGKQIANVVVSPIDGSILYRGVDVGDPVISISSAQTATTLFTIANMQELMFQGLVDERDAAKIQIDMIAKIKIGSLPGQEVSGKVSRIALQSDKEKSSVSGYNSNEQASSPFNVGFKIEITDLQFPKGLVLRSGYSATASIAIKSVDDVLMLPLRVIQYKDTKPHVLLLTQQGREPKQQPVELGVNDSINVEIKSGLKLGDTVVDQQEDPTAQT